MEEDYKYIDENNNEYIIVKTTECEGQEYVMMMNLNDCDDYFFASFSGENNSELDIVEDEVLLKKIIDSVQ